MVAGGERRQLLTAPGNLFGRDDAVASAGGHRLFDPRQRVLGQELQHANVMSGARQPPVARFKALAQLGKRRRQAPVAVDVGVIEVGWLHAERGQIVQRIEHLLALLVGPLVLSHPLAVAADLHAINVRFHGDCGEGVTPRHAVAVLLPGDRLVLVDLADLAHRGVEWALRQRQGARSFTCEAGADGFALTRNHPLPVPLTAGAQVRVQLRQIAEPRNGRRPLALQQLHPVLDVRLLVAPRRQAEQGIEPVVAGQGLPPLVQLPLPTGEDRRGDRLGIIPPQFPGCAAEERQGLDRAVQDRLGLFARQRDHERGVRIGPGHQQDRNLAPAFWEVDPDMAEVALGALPRLVGERQERLAAPAATGGHVPPHLVIAAGVMLFVS